MKRMTLLFLLILFIGCAKKPSSPYGNDLRQGVATNSVDDKVRIYVPDYEDVSKQRYIEVAPGQYKTYWLPPGIFSFRVDAVRAAGPLTIAQGQFRVNYVQLDASFNGLDWDWRLDANGSYQP